jgi:RPA family protein
MGVKNEDEEIDDVVRSYLIKKHGQSINKIVINCVITQLTIMQQVREFKHKQDVFEAIDECSFQYIEICR